MEKLKTRYYNLQNLSIFLSYIPIFKSIFNNEFECSIENSGRLKHDYFEKSYLMRLVIYSTLNMSSWNMSAKISIDQVLRNKSRVINNATAEKLQVHLLILIKIFLEIRARTRKSFSNHSFFCCFKNVTVIKSLPKIFERVKTWLLLSLINKGKTEFILNN